MAEMAGYQVGDELIYGRARIEVSVVEIVSATTAEGGETTLYRVAPLNLLLPADELDARCVRVKRKG